MAVTTKSPMLLSRQRKRGRESRMRSCISSKWTLYKQSTQAWIFSYQNANYHDVWHQITWGVRGKGVHAILEKIGTMDGSQNIWWTFSKIKDDPD